MNDNPRQPVIAKEGWPFIGASVALMALFLAISVYLGLFGVLLVAFVTQFFRDPIRERGSDDPRAVLSAADGRIVAIEETVDPFREEPAIKISVFMNVFNVHSNKSPCSGAVEEARYIPGRFLNAALEKSSVENERNAVLLRTDSGHKVTFVQIAGLVARRIVCYARKDDRLKAGERYGLIRFGSRVDHYVPVGSDVQVAIGDKVKGVETVLAMLPKTARGAGAESAPGEAIENGAQNGAEGGESGPDSAAPGDAAARGEAASAGARGAQD